MKLSGCVEPAALVVDLGSDARCLEPVCAPQALAAGAAVGALTGTPSSRWTSLSDGADRRGSFPAGQIFVKPGCWSQLEQAMQSRPGRRGGVRPGPNLSGIGSVDTARVADLIELAIDFCQGHLKPEGRAGGQGFPWQRLPTSCWPVQANFRTVKPFSPKRPRDRSSETFLVELV